MNQRFRTITALGLLGVATLGLMPFGCGSRLGPVRASQNGGIDHPNLPDITVEHAKDCVAEYGQQLEAGYHVLKSNVLVNVDGDKENVTINDLPATAPDFGACVRSALRDMPVSEDLVGKAAEHLKFQRKQASASQGSLVSSPVVVVVGVTIVVAELVLEAGAYTILFAVTVKVVDKAKDDVLDALKRRPPITDGEDDKECVDGYERCILSGGGVRGNNWNTTVCENCLRVCQNKGGWPYSVPIFGRGNPLCY